ncbi:MAG: GNAT family N-acetyltransferase [Candidatus Methanoperedens sp.]|nr:GNAT family N-acetyltransferase [Candidatus Methanoperedens sp.]
MDKIPDQALQIVLLNKKHDIDSFNSDNVDLNDFLKSNAIKDQEDRVSRTYLCFLGKTAVGYFSLVTDTLEVHVVEGNDGIKDYLYRKYPSIRIARLAVDQKVKKKGIGKFMLLAAIGIAIDVSNKVGCRYITVDSKPESIGFYEKNNFKVIEQYKHSDFPKMYLNMYPIIAMMQPKESLYQKVEIIPKKIDWYNEDDAWKEYTAKRITRE